MNKIHGVFLALAAVVLIAGGIVLTTTGATAHNVTCDPLTPVCNLGWCKNCQNGGDAGEPCWTSRQHFVCIDCQQWCSIQ